MTTHLVPAPPRTMSDFDGHNGQFGGGRAIHTVAPTPWLDDQEVPGPACHTPAGGFDPSIFQPVTHDVTCRRCLRSPHARATAAPAIDPDQLALPLDERSNP